MRPEKGRGLEEGVKGKYHCGTCLFFTMDTVFEEYKCGYPGMCGGHHFGAQPCSHYFPTKKAPVCVSKGKPQMSHHSMREDWHGAKAWCLHCGFEVRRGEYVPKEKPVVLQPATSLFEPLCVRIDP